MRHNKQTKDEKVIIKNLIYFLLAMLVAFCLGLVLCLLLNIEIGSKEFWICIAAAGATFYTGYRTANLSRPFTISEYIWKRNPLELELIAMEAIGNAIIKKTRETEEEKERQKEILKRINAIKTEIENSKNDK